MPFDLHSWRERIARLAANSARAILTANNGRVALSISVASFLYKKALPLSHLNKAEFFGSELMTKSEARRRDSRGLLLTTKYPTWYPLERDDRYCFVELRQPNSAVAEVRPEFRNFVPPHLPTSFECKTMRPFWVLCKVF